MLAGDKAADCMIEMKEEARRKRRKKKTATSLVTSCFYGKQAEKIDANFSRVKSVGGYDGGVGNDAEA